jgi:hypothetical protein
MCFFQLRTQFDNDGLGSGMLYMPIFQQGSRCPQVIHRPVMACGNGLQTPFELPCLLPVNADLLLRRGQFGTMPFCCLLSTRSQGV